MGTNLHKSFVVLWVCHEKFIACLFDKLFGEPSKDLNIKNYNSYAHWTNKFSFCHLVMELGPALAMYRLC